jgi:Family of unknown function (DUF6221)
VATVTTDPLAWVRAEMDAAEKEALAAQDGNEPETWHVAEQGACECCDAIRTDKGNLVLTVDDRASDFIARHDPAAVLRRIKAERASVEDLLAERHDVNDGDCWYTCAAATEEHDGDKTCDDTRLGKPCDCGRDARVERRVRQIAEGWGWTEETT